MKEKQSKRRHADRACKNGVLNCLRASYRTISESNKRVLKDENVNFMQDYFLRFSDDNELKDHIRTFPWMSYRSDFKEINGFSSDSGWG